MAEKKPSQKELLAAKGLHRLTADIPLTLHRKIKSSCGARGVKIGDEVSKALDEYFKNK